MEALFTDIVAIGTTETVLIAETVAVQNVFEPVTMYVLVVAGLATTTLPEELLKLALGLQV